MSHDTIKTLQDLRAAFRNKADQATIAADTAPTHDERQFARGTAVGFRVAEADVLWMITELRDKMRSAA